MLIFTVGLFVWRKVCQEVGSMGGGREDGCFFDRSEGREVKWSGGGFDISVPSIWIVYFRHFRSVTLNHFHFVTSFLSVFWRCNSCDLLGATGCDENCSIWEPWAVGNRGHLVTNWGGVNWLQQVELHFLGLLDVNCVFKFTSSSGWAAFTG